MSNELIREQLVKFLKEKGVMQKKIAEICETSPTTINLFLQGKRSISYKKLLAIHQYIKANN